MAFFRLLITQQFTSSTGSHKRTLQSTVNTGLWSLTLRNQTNRTWIKPWKKGNAHPLTFIAFLHFRFFSPVTKAFIMAFHGMCHRLFHLPPFVARCGCGTVGTKSCSPAATSGAAALRDSTWAEFNLFTTSNHEKNGTFSIWMFPKIVGFRPKSSIFVGFSIINHPFWENPYFWKHPYQPVCRNLYILLMVRKSS